MNKTIILITLLLILISLASAQQEPELYVGDNSQAQQICNYLSSQIASYVGQELPTFIPYQNEVANIYTQDESVIGSIVLKEGKLDSISCSETQEPTYIVHIKNLQTVQDVRDAQNPLDEYTKKLSNDEIDISGVTLGKKIKNTFTTIGLRIGSWFS